MSPITKKICAIYTRKSSEEGLEQEFNSLHAQREACAAFIQSQKHEGWRLHPSAYDDGGFSGGSMERPALGSLMADIRAGLIDIVVVYKVDRLTRSLADFSKMVEAFDARGISLVAVTQQLNTSTSMGRLTLNVLLSFAQFEREITGERIRDKLTATAKKGLWRGGTVPLGYDIIDRRLVVNEAEAVLVGRIFERYLALGHVAGLKAELDGEGRRSKVRINAKGQRSGGHPFTRGALYRILQNRIYLGEIVHKGSSYPGEHLAIVDDEIFRHAQEQLARHSVKREAGSNGKSTSLLTGLLFDDLGNPLSPSHTAKQGRRYRYYVNQALIQFRPQDAGAIRRIPATEIEEVVTSHLLGLLADHQRLIGTLLPADTDTYTCTGLMAVAGRTVDAWPDMSQADRQKSCRRAIHRVTVSPGEIVLTLSRTGLGELLDVEAGTERGQDEEITLSVEARLKRIGAETRFIIPGHGGPPPACRQDPALIDALVQAHAWARAFIENPGTSLSAITKGSGYSPAYTYRLLPLAYLAPDITLAILAGNQPRGLSLKKLLRGIPASWAQQRERFGFPQLGSTAP